ncbi:unnamed protein product [Phytophthora fragariaefolia]|uniref:Unnamed protein product n=1 Tax=Phytophthora fragariaefolia TaxID=1490495 RepID=A0A9W6YLN8_9STRA|nr:unnamed protein product [Phytophthora fragariaefolia]
MSNVESDAKSAREIELPEHAAELYHRKTLDLEILEGDKFFHTEVGVRLNERTPNLSELDNTGTSTKDLNPGIDGTNGEDSMGNSRSTSLDRKNNESQSVCENALALQVNEPSLTSNPNYDERDPEVIQQLRLLIAQNTAAKERVAASGGRYWCVVSCV